MTEPPSSPPHRAAVLVLMLVLLAAVVVAASGCTQRQDPEDYAVAVDKALSVRNDVVGQLDSGKLQGAPAYAAAQKQVQDVSDAMDSQPPPRKFEKAHNLMVDSMDGLAVLLGKLGRCEGLQQTSLQDARACRQSIKQDVFDTLRNDFTEFDAIYRQAGLSSSKLGGADDQSGSGGGDVLNGS